MNSGNIAQYQQHPSMRPVSRMMSPQPNIQQNMGRSGSRQQSQKKVTYYSPQIKDQYGMSQNHIKYNHEQRPQPQSQPQLFQQVTSNIAIPMQ